MNVPHPVLKYYGSKFRIADWIISHFPQHRHYVEPFGGAANVLLVKEPSRLETYNDLDKGLVNFFRVLRQRPDDLIRVINLTPWSRSEYEFCLFEPDSQDPIENARRLYFRLWMCFQGTLKAHKGNFRRHKSGKRSVVSDVKTEDLIAASKRLRLVQIENRDAFKLMSEFDSPDSLFYLDPPYVFSTRTTKKAYSFEMTDDKHREFAELICGLKGFVVLSGYPSGLYEGLFDQNGWRRVEKETMTTGHTKRTECLWLSPRTAAALAL